MLFRFPLLIVCMFDPFLKKKIAIWHMERKHIIPWEHSYLSNRFFTSHYVSASWVRQDLTSVDQILFALSDFRTFLKACVVSRDTLTRSTLNDVLLTFSGSFVYAWTRCGCYTRSVATLGIASFSLLTDSHEQGYWFESLTMDFCQCSLRTGSR